MEVGAIKEIKKINKIKKLLENENKIKELALFTLGLNSALRISDLLKLKWANMMENDGKTFKKYVELVEGKTSKYKKFAINENIKSSLKKLMKDYDINLDDFIFKSDSNRVSGSNKAWSRQYAYTFLNKYAVQANVKGNIGTHTLRKTFGYFAYESGVDISLLVRIFNHSSQAITLKYIGITEEEIDAVYLNIVNL